jgi:1-acyl-sn-glycerol-3-phosphate acyltransferase
VILRGGGVVCLICLCLVECLLRAMRRPDAVSRAAILQRWSGRILSCLRVQVSMTGTVPAKGLIVCNHVSYLDILVLSSAARCVFLAKSEIKSWPFIGWIASLTGTVFIDRSRRIQTHHLQPQVQRQLKSGLPLLLFPEGTSTDGRNILPFRSSFFQAAVTVAAPVTAAYLAYELPEGDGDPVTDIAYWGEMTLLPQFFKLLTKARATARLRFSDCSRVFFDRKQAAREMEQEVSELGNQIHEDARALH